MTIRVDDVRGVAGFIQPGDRVDVVLIRTEAKSKSNDSYSDMILQSAKVLAIDQITGERTEKATIAKAVTLKSARKTHRKSCWQPTSDGYHLFCVSPTRLTPPQLDV